MPQPCLVPVIFVLAAALALLSGASAQEPLACKAVAEGGAWDLPATWVDCNNATPGVSDSALVSGENVHVTITSGQSVQVASLLVEDSALLTNAGTMRVVELQVLDKALVRSTGPLDLMHQAGSPTTPGLYCQQSSIQLSRGLSVIGPHAKVELELCELTIKGSLNITSDESSNAHLTVSIFSHLSVSGDLTLLGSYDSEESTYLYWDSILEVGGDLRLETRSDLTTSGLVTPSTRGVVAPSTGSVVAAFSGGQASVGGDLVIKSGDSLATATGPAALMSPGYLLSEELFDIFQIPEFSGALPGFAAGGSIAVGGSVEISSGSVTGFLGDGAPEVTSGLAGFNLANTDLTAASVSVVSGYGGNGTVKGGSAAAAMLLLGLNAKLIVSTDVVVKSSDGGNGASDTANGGNSAQALFSVLSGGEALIGGSLSILGGSGGNASLAESASGGDGGAGTVSVAGAALIASGSGGTGAAGGSTQSASMSLVGIPYFFDMIATRAKQAARQFGGELGTAGGLNLRVGGDLTLLSGNAASSIAEGAPGGSCIMDEASGISEFLGGGFLLLGTWEAEIVIGGDLRVTGCSGGSSVGARGGLPTMITGLLVMGGATIDVYGSVEVEGGNGGSVVGGSQDAGFAGLAFVLCLGSDLVDIAGSLTITRGNGGDVVNGTGATSSVDSAESALVTGVMVSGSSHLIVGSGKGAITVNGGRAGNVDAAATEGSSSYGGSGGSVVVGALDRSSITAGNVRLVGRATGNSFTNSSILTRRDAAQKRITWPNIALNKGDYQQWRRHVRSIEDISLDYLNSLTAGPVVLSLTHSTVTINGKLEILPGAAGATNLLPPQSGLGAALVVVGHATLVLNGDALISAAAGSRTESSDVPLADTVISLEPGEGGVAAVAVAWESTLTARGNVVLQGGYASQGPNATTGTQGSASIILTDQSRFDQSGLVSLKDGVGLVNETVVAITVSRSEWTVYPCPDAGLELSAERNSSAFVVEAFATFRDCRGSGARQRYPEPSVVGQADGSCSPCSCSEASFSSCPAASSASGLHSNAPLAWLIALF